MTKIDFIKRLRAAVSTYSAAISTADGQWSVKGFIDVYKRIYTISNDTKVVSKIMELYLFPLLCQFAKDNNCEMELAKEQNSYPDITFKDSEGNLFAVDVKSSYRKSDTKINGMTLGAFTGYFRNRQSTKNVSHPYQDYAAHIVLGVIYSDNYDASEESDVYSMTQLKQIKSVIKDFTFFVQEKWRIAIDRPGSGNTKNIGSVSDIDALIAGRGSFADLGEEIFDDYWMNYLTLDMARKAELVKPYYTDVESYKAFRHLK